MPSGKSGLQPAHPAGGHHRHLGQIQRGPGGRRQAAQATQVDQHGGRIEQRRPSDWPHLAQVCRLERSSVPRANAPRANPTGVGLRRDHGPTKPTPKQTSGTLGHREPHWVRDVTAMRTGPRCALRAPDHGRPAQPVRSGWLAKPTRRRRVAAPFTHHVPSPCLELPANNRKDSGCPGNRACAKSPRNRCPLILSLSNDAHGD